MSGWGWEVTSPEGPLGGQQRKGMPQIEAHLGAELGDGASAGAVAFDRPSLNDIPHHIQILQALQQFSSCSETA